jgi:RNA polymerase primary sigma factor/RNA polymerase sigma factor
MACKKEDLSSFAAESQDSKFMTRGQEVHLFRKMNFLKYQAAQLHEAIDPSQARSADLDRVEELLREAGAIRNRIIRSCLWLVVSIVKMVVSKSPLGASARPIGPRRCA